MKIVRKLRSGRDMTRSPLGGYNAAQIFFEIFGQLVTGALSPGSRYMN